ncbi:MAG: YqaE/Pmp3 family membrane protein [Saprospiraceae bacterium]
MKQIILSALCVLFLGNYASAEIMPKTVKIADLSSATDVRAIDPKLMQMGMDQFLNLTPAKYKEVTGKRLGLKNSLALKAAQAKVKHEMKKNDLPAPGDGITKGLYVLLAFLGLGWLAMGLLSDWDGSDWIINLVLTALCWLPGFIHALVKMKDYYSN